MKIALMPNLSKQNAHTYTVRIIKRLLELQCEIFLYAKYRDYFDIQTIHFYEDFSDMVRECDAVITIGETARLSMRQSMPLRQQSRF